MFSKHTENHNYHMPRTNTTLWLSGLRFTSQTDYRQREVVYRKLVGHDGRTLSCTRNDLPLPEFASKASRYAATSVDRIITEKHASDRLFILNELQARCSNNLGVTHTPCHQAEPLEMRRACNFPE